MELDATEAARLPGADGATPWMAGPVCTPRFAGPQAFAWKNGWPGVSGRPTAAQPCDPACDPTMRARRRRQLVTGRAAPKRDHDDKRNKHDATRQAGRPTPPLWCDDARLSAADVSREPMRADGLRAPIQQETGRFDGVAPEGVQTQRLACRRTTGRPERI